MKSKASKAVRSMAVFGVAIAAAVVATVASAADEPIKVSRTVPYADINVGSAAVRSECDWNKLIIDQLVEYSKGQIEATDEDLDTVHGRKLVLTIIGVRSTPGGQIGTNYGAGDKFGSISGKLMDHDQVVDSFELTRKSGGGFMIFTACGTLDRIAKALASDTWHHLQQAAKSAPPQQPAIAWKSQPASSASVTAPAGQ